MQPLIVAGQVTQGVADILRTAFPSTTPGFIGLLERFLAQRDTIFKVPCLTVPPPFRSGTRKERPPFAWLPESFVPHAHQAKAFARLTGEAARSTLMATGTGSGKTEAFLFPVLEHCRLARGAGERGGRTGIKAVIFYLMNALATNQAARLAKTIVTTPELRGLCAGLYVGETPEVESDAVMQRDDCCFTLINHRPGCAARQSAGHLADPLQDAGLPADACS